jgi:hypothetical protein
MSGLMNGLALRVRVAGAEEGFEDSNVAEIKAKLRDWLAGRGLTQEFNPCFGMGKKRARAGKKKGGKA